MSWLKSLFGSKDLTPTVVRQPVGYVEHLRHWYFLEAMGEIETVHEQLLDQLFQSKTSKGLQAGDFVHVVDNQGPLMLSAIADAQAIRTSYPYVDVGFGWPLTVREVTPWANGIEGQVTVSCHGAKICLFDTLYFRNQKTYDAGKTRTFVVSALAYKIYPQAPDPAFAEDFCGYMPVSTDNGGGQDEVQFMTRIEAIEECQFWGIPMVALTVTLAKPEDFPMRVTMYAPVATLPLPVKVGDRISGYAWLFGFAKD